MIEVVKLSDIIKRGQIYYFHKRKPDDIRHLLEGNGSHRTFSLKTKDMKTAKEKAQDERDRWEALRSVPQQPKKKQHTAD